MKSVLRVANISKQIKSKTISYSYSTISEIKDVSAGFGFTKEELVAAKPYTDIPGPKIHPVIGNLLSFKPFGDLNPFDREDFLKILHNRYGPISKLSIPFLGSVKDAVILFDPNDFEIIHRNEGRFPSRLSNPTFQKFRESRGQSLGILFSNDEEWWKFRQPLNKRMMKAEAATPYLSILDEIGDELVNNINVALNNNGNMRHPMIMRDMFRWTLESACAIVFDRRLGCMDAYLKNGSWQQEFIDSVHGIFKNMIPLGLNPIHRFYDYIGYKAKQQIEFERCADIIAEMSLRLVKEARDGWMHLPEEELKKKFLFQLLSVKTLSLDEKVTAIFDILLAAVDTTAYATLYNLFHLAQNPDTQEKLLVEINQHVDIDGSELNPKRLSKLRYLRACVKETHRLKLIVPALRRVLPKDVLIKGFKIPKGTLVVADHQFVSRNAEYVSDPNIFKPERWLRSEISKEEVTPPFLVLPFGFGPRMCIGKRFAEQELYIALIKLVKHFRFEYDGDTLPLKGIGLDKLPKKLDFIIHER